MDLILDANAYLSDVRIEIAMRLRIQLDLMHHSGLTRYAPLPCDLEFYYEWHERGRHRRRTGRR